MTSIRTHLYFADEDNTKFIKNLLTKFLEINQDYKITSMGPICSYVQQINFRLDHKRITKEKKENKYVEKDTDVLIPKKTKLDLKHEFDEMQIKIFDSLAKKHKMMDVL